MSSTYEVCQPGGRRYKSVASQFAKQWKHPPSAKPRYRSIVRIVKVTPPDNLRLRYNRYRANLEKRGKFSRRKMRPGNERRRWHGTLCRNCQFLQQNLPPKGRTQSSRVCVICSIINTGLRKPKPRVPSNEKWGFGIYLSGTSSKSDDYTGQRVNGQAKPATGVRALILCAVAVGRGLKVKRYLKTIVRAPRGYDSVIGDPKVFPGLNYDELVTYDIASCLPSYVVVYR